MMSSKADSMSLVLSAFILNLFISPLYSSENATESVLRNETETDTVTDKNDITFGKDESLSSCMTITMDEGEYELFDNGTLYIEPYKLTLNEPFYIRNKTSVIICSPLEKKTSVTKDYVEVSAYITQVGVVISMICLLAHLVVFAIVPDLRNLPGWNLAALCASLFISYLLIFLIGIFRISDNRSTCIAMASLAHFFLLSSFMWMSLTSFDVFMSLLRATRSLQASSTQFKLKKFGIYSLCAFGVALLFAVSSLMTELLDIAPQSYKPGFEEKCWFSEKQALLVFFAGPALALICLNVIFFGLSTYILCVNQMRINKDDNHTILRRNYLMFLRLSVIMGITWILGLFAPILNTDWVWYIFAILNSLQGLYIFLAFTCSNKVKRYFTENLLGRKGASEQTNTTFQSDYSAVSSGK